MERFTFIAAGLGAAAALASCASTDLGSTNASLAATSVPAERAESTAGGAEEPNAAADEVATGPVEAALGAEVVASQPASLTGSVPEVEPAPAYRVPSEVALDLWRDETFRRQFTESYQAETDIEPRLTDRSRDTMIQVQQLLSEGSPDVALDLLQKEREKGDNAAFALAMGNILFEREQLEEARDEFEVAVDLHRKFYRGWKNLAMTQYSLGDYEATVEAIAKAIELKGADGYLYGVLGLSCTALGKHATAETAFRLASVHDPLSPEWERRLAYSYHQQKKYADAAALAGELLERNVEDVMLWKVQAGAFAGLGDLRRAAENYEMLDFLGESTAETLRTLGNIYINEGSYDLAGDAYGRSIALDDGSDLAATLESIENLSNRGADEPTTALLVSFKERFEAEIDDDLRRDVLKIEARLALRAGGGAEEAKILEAVVALDPFDGDALLTLGDFSFKQKDYEKALYYFERAVSLERFEANARVRVGQVLIAQGELELALKSLNTAQRLSYRDAVQQLVESVESAIRNG